jgi:long-chain acyl-CoA synthetase
VFKAYEQVIDRIYRVCDRLPDNTALVYLGESFTYRNLAQLIEVFATALHDLGVRTDDRVMLYLPNIFQFLIAYLAAQLIGAVPVSVSPIHTSSEIRYLLNDSGASTIICMDTNFRYVSEVFGQVPLDRIIVTTFTDMLPFYKKAFGFLFDRVPDGRIEKNNHVHRFGKLLSQYPPHPPKVNFDPARHPCCILYTGGTTGFPKGCVYTYPGMISFIDEIQQAGMGHIREGRDTLIMVNPLFHQLAQGMIFGMVLNRANTAILMPVPEVDAILDAIQRHKVTLFPGAPTLYRAILENDRLDIFDLSSLRFCWSGGETLPAEVFNRWETAFNRPIYQLYGSAEVGFVAMSPLDHKPSPTRLGKPFASRKTMVVDPATLQPVPRGEPGELLVTSEFISTQYWNNPEETNKAYVEIEGEVWYRMNDFVTVDENGELSYVDRRPDIIKHEGHTVSCSMIEAVLQSHPAVIGSCVIGVPYSELDERIKAIVVLKEDARGVGGAELLRWCSERLEPHEVPQYIEFRDMLPLSKVGKLLRREIRDEEQRRIARKRDNWPS